MKINLLNTLTGLIPMYSDDLDEKKKLKIGHEYLCEIKPIRNLKFHRKYFALIKCSWEYQNEKVQEFFKNNIDLFRKTVEVSAGHCDFIYSIERKEWVEIPKSISFEKCDEAEFEELYNRILDVLLKTFLNDIPFNEFEENLKTFYD